MRAHKAVSEVSSVRRTTNNNMGRNLFDIFSTHDLVIFFHDLIISTHDLEVKRTLES
jgi:hypothetical protein